ncbi:hypothetical protein Micbo1qcDRAFT_163761 [Microdochium bolleyi]|uniref:Ubiquitin-like domain-containing protein n=1 Tax=Microdochium bolleyi TaxID=196109 RepID=A0A136J1H4_9PEZI|nr:hypothetical protein Micbo1qcDRAFT_163761 [Microdochium bolleyi]
MSGPCLGQAPGSWDDPPLPSSETQPQPSPPSPVSAAAAAAAAAAPPPPLATSSSSSGPMLDARLSPSPPSSSLPLPPPPPPLSPPSSTIVQLGEPHVSSPAPAPAAEDAPASGPPSSPPRPRPDKGKAPLRLDGTRDISAAQAAVQTGCCLDTLDHDHPGGSGIEHVVDNSPDSPGHQWTAQASDDLFDWPDKADDAFNEASSVPSSAAAGPRTRDDEPLDLPIRTPLQVGEPGWERSADRPPMKLPIRFKDAVGRHFVFPWEKAKTWEGMRTLINSCFIHVDILGPHVMNGHYDLFTTVSFSMDNKSSGASFGFPDAETSSAGQAQADPPAQSTATDTASNAPASPAATAISPAPPSTNVVILPEVWDMLIEPGMFVTQGMWPMQNVTHPPPPPPHPPGTMPGWHGVMPHPPGGRGGVVGGGGGRGRGRGRGGMGGGVGRGGAGLPPPPPPPGPWMMPPPPPPPGQFPILRPGFSVIEPSPRRAKTRKRRA